MGPRGGAGFGALGAGRARRAAGRDDGRRRDDDVGRAPVPRTRFIRAPGALDGRERFVVVERAPVAARPAARAASTGDGVSRPTVFGGALRGRRGLRAQAFSPADRLSRSLRGGGIVGRRAARAAAARAASRHLLRCWSCFVWRLVRQSSSRPIEVSPIFLLLWCVCSVEAAAPLLGQPRSAWPAERVRERVAGCCPVMTRVSSPRRLVSACGRLLFP